MITDFTVLPKQFGIAATWTFPPNTADSRSTRIRVSFQAQEGAPTNYEVYDVAYPTSDFELNGLQPHTFVYMQAALVDSYGNEGEYTSWANAQVAADPEALLEALNGHIGLAAITEELAKDIADGVIAKEVAEAAAISANTANVAAANAKTTADTATAKADNAATAAVNAKTQADNAATQADKGIKDAAAAMSAANKEAVDRATALTQQATTLKADSTAKVDALKSEIDPKIASLQDGVTKVTTDYKAADTAVVGQLNAYKTSNDNAVASVLQKAESAVSTGSSNSTAITALNSEFTTIKNDVQSKASTAALTALTTRITEAEGVNTTQSSNITNLRSDMTEVQSDVATKASAQALSDLTTRMVSEEGRSTTQATQITSLSASMDTLSGKVNTKADASALSTTNAEVSSVKGQVTAQATQLTNLTTTVSNNRSELVDNYYTKTQADSSTAGQITEYKASLRIGGKNQLINSEAERTSRSEYLLYEASPHLKSFYDDNLGQDVTISGEIKSPCCR